MQVSWKHSHAVLYVQGSTSRSLVCRPKRRLTGIFILGYLSSGSDGFSLFISVGGKTETARLATEMMLSDYLISGINILLLKHYA